mmetsp:Transcript_33269/g.70003  ORF Transcript_33269/g.70003 Transcript_33269/m.70003 type:complete len:119 (-) Transcript_33269:1000-1356(-)
MLRSALCVKTHSIAIHKHSVIHGSSWRASSQRVSADLFTLIFEYLHACMHVRMSTLHAPSYARAQPPGNQLEARPSISAIQFQRFTGKTSGKIRAAAAINMDQVCSKVCLVNPSVLTS